MNKAIQHLVDSGMITEATRTAINEAWEEKLAEAKETVRAELREEFATRYEHDKKVMADAVNKFVEEGLEDEIEEFKDEKDQIAADRVKEKKEVKEHAKRIQNFIAENLAKELKELRLDRSVQREGFKKMKSFVRESLKKEISEFAEDKKALVETRVKLIKQAKKALTEAKNQFLRKAAVNVQRTVNNSLKTEIGQLKEDIQIAHENMFGRKLFEAFASEFATSHLNESKEMAKLNSIVKAKQKQVEKAKLLAEKAIQQVKLKERQIQLIQESKKRNEILAELLKPLNKEKSSLMMELLENVQTDKLSAAFDKYLPSVINGNTKTFRTKSQLTESRQQLTEVTGNRKQDIATPAQIEEESNVVELRKLAGLN